MDKGKKLYLYIDGKLIGECTPHEIDIKTPLYQLKKRTVVGVNILEYQCNYINVLGESELIILN